MASYNNIMAKHFKYNLFDNMIDTHHLMKSKETCFTREVMQNFCVVILYYSGKLRATEIFKNGNSRLEHDSCIKIEANKQPKSG